MPFAINKTNGSWRMVGQESEIDQDAEVFALERPKDTGIEAALIRAERDLRLLKADHKINALEDVGMAAGEWRAYRSLLRAVPEQPGFPEQVEWPETPV